MLYTATSKARVIALAGFAAVTVVGAALWHTDLLVARGFGKALEGAKPTLSFQPATKKGTPVQTVAGDEGYWLTRAEVESPTPFAKPLSLGDRITISGGDGRTQQLEIVDLKAVAGTLPVATTGSGVAAPADRHLPQRRRNRRAGPGALHRRGRRGRSWHRCPAQDPLDLPHVISAKAEIHASHARHCLA